jgi:putative SOS response-associated peptidase YedK
MGRVAQAGWEACGSFTIITTEPNELVRPVHNRMPVILQPKDEEQWLDTSRISFAQARSLLKPYPENLMDAYDVSPIVNSAKYDGPECIRPVSDDDVHRAGQLSLLSTTIPSSNCCGLTMNRCSCANG